MSGAFISPTVLASAKGQDVTCRYCGTAAATTEHLLWHCKELPGERPCAKPSDPLQARLAWPVNCRLDEPVLQWACHVRLLVLNDRYQNS